MERLIPYKGDAPYIFISYAHRDKEAVFPVIASMQEAGFRVWFDEGIDPGTEWDNVIATQIEKCGYFLAFVSVNYLASENCKDELNYARDLDKHRLLVYLEEVTLPGGMAMRMNRIQSVFKYKYADEKIFYDVLYSADGIYEMCDGERPKRTAQGTGSGRTSGANGASGTTGTADGGDPYYPGGRGQGRRGHRTVGTEVPFGNVASRYFSYLKELFTGKPTLAQLLRRLFVAFAYISFMLTPFGNDLGEFGSALSLLLIPFGACTLVVSLVERQRVLKRDGFLPPPPYERRGHFVAAHILFGFALGFLSLKMQGDTGMPLFLALIWCVYCLFHAFLSPACARVKLFGGISVPKKLFTLITCVLTFLAFLGNA